MTDHIETNEPVPELHGIIEAFLDGEAVDPAMLRAALADEAARDHFVDLLAIRGLLRGVDAVAPGAANQTPGGRPRARWLAAAAALVVSLTAGYVAGQRAMASTGGSTVEAVVVGGGTPDAPQPTRSIRFTPGVNWTDRPGGR